MLGSVFNKVTGLNACNFIKKKLQYKCFPVKNICEHCFCLFNVVLCGYPGAQRAMWREGVLPCPFLKIEKKFPDFAKKSAYIMEKIMCLHYTCFCASLG